MADVFCGGFQVGVKIRQDESSNGRKERWMTNASPREVTQLLEDWSHGDQAALERLMPLVYQELRVPRSPPDGPGTPGPHASNYGAGERSLPCVWLTKSAHTGRTGLTSSQSLRN